MKTEILLIQHTDATTPGVVLPWLKDSKVAYRHIRLQKGEALPEPQANQSLILCGGGVHPDQEAQYAWLKPEKKFIEDHIKLGNKIVGLCLGGQLCAQILGAKVYPHKDQWEVGWWDVTLHETPGLKGFEQTKAMKFSQYHRYIFENPKEAKIVASNDWWPVQAFLWKQQILGFQFHPERSLEGNVDCAMDIDLPTLGQTQTKEQIIAGGTLHQPMSAKWFTSVLNGFLLATKD